MASWALKAVGLGFAVALVVLAVVVPGAGGASTTKLSITPIEATFVPSEFATHYAVGVTGPSTMPAPQIYARWELARKCIDPGCPDSSGMPATPRPDIDAGCDNNSIGTKAPLAQTLNAGQMPEFVWHHPSASDDPGGPYHCDHAKEGPRGHQGIVSVLVYFRQGTTLVECTASFDGTKSSTPTSVQDGTASTPICSETRCAFPLKVLAPHGASRAAFPFDVRYSGSFTAEGGTPPYSFRADAPGRRLPEGVKLDSVSGTLSADLAGTHTKLGNHPLVVSVTDSAGCRGSTLFQLVVEPAQLRLGTGAVDKKHGVGGIYQKCDFLANCAFLLSVGYPEGSKAPRRASRDAVAAALTKIGIVTGKVPAGKTGKIAIRLTKHGLDLLKRKHKLETTAVGTVRHGKTTIPVQGTLTLHLAS